MQIFNKSVYILLSRMFENVDKTQEAHPAVFRVTLKTAGRALCYYKRDCVDNKNLHLYNKYVEVLT